MKNILITGSTGFIGKNLTKYFIEKNKYKAYCLVRTNSNLKNLTQLVPHPNLITFDGKLDSLNQVFKEKSFYCIFHLASLFLSEHTSDDISNLISSNILLGTQLLECCSKFKVPYFINTGTIWQNYKNKHYSPVNLYSATKQAFEDILTYYHEKNLVKSITLRIYDTYGQNDHRLKLIPFIKKVLDTNTELSMSSGNQYIDLVHVNDIINAFSTALKLLERNDNNLKSVYGVSSKKPILLKELINIVSKITKKNFKVNWGARKDRIRDIYEPISILPQLPTWEPKINLETGLREVLILH